MWRNPMYDVLQMNVNEGVFCVYRYVAAYLTALPPNGSHANYLIKTRDWKLIQIYPISEQFS